MKNRLLLLGCLVITSLLQAQHFDSINNHMAGHYCLNPHDAIQLADGNFLIMNRQDSLTTHDNTQQVIPYLTKFYKISRLGNTILDSITFDTTYCYFDSPANYSCVKLARLHRMDGNYGNILMCIKEETIMNLTFFDDNLNFNDEMEVSFSVPNSLEICFFILDSNDDIILNYYTEDSTYFARFGLDGTPKHIKAYHVDVVPNVTTPISPGLWYRVDGLKQYGNNPLGYNYFGVVKSSTWGTGKCWGYELDSLFNITHQFELNDSSPGYPYYTCNPYFDPMLSQGDGTAYFVRNVWLHPSRWATAVQKVNEQGEVIESVKFQPCPRPYNQIKAIDMEKDGDGNICYSFYGLDMDSCHYVATVKLDADLNILWERYALRMQAPYQEFMREARGMKIFNDGVKIAVLVFGYNHCFNWDYYNGANPNNEPYLRGLYMMLMSEKAESIAESESVFRPYLAYPNPAHDQLYMHFSPDVQPKQVELYDLQGRLVRTQRSNFGSIDMNCLPAGIYMMRVTLEDGTVFSDKVVKE